MREKKEGEGDKREKKEKRERERREKNLCNFYKIKEKGIKR